METLHTEWYDVIGSSSLFSLYQARKIRKELICRIGIYFISTQSFTTLDIKNKNNNPYSYKLRTPKPNSWIPLF